ncbi:MAG: hypothetical protein ACQESL_00380, partial [Bacteroidota bacterium]
MKTLLKITGVLLLALVATSCSSTYDTTANSDDVYYSPGLTRGGDTAQTERETTEERGRVVEVVEEGQESATANQQAQHTDNQQAYAGDDDAYYTNNNNTDTVEYYDDEAYYDDEGNIVHNYYYGDYYDYSYAARIRRFHRGYLTPRYYDPFYTNMYFYGHHPYFFGTSIYMGFSPSPLYFGGYYTPYHYYNPYWAYGHWGYPGFGGYGGYMSGYYYGFMHGLHHGYGGYGYWGYPQYFYNSFDGTLADYHYGPRGSTGSTIGRTVDNRDNRSRTTFAERFEERTYRDEDGKRRLADERSASTSGQNRTAAVFHRV